VFARGFLFTAVSFGQALILPRPSTKIDIFSIQRNAQQSPETRKTSFARHCGTCSLWYCVNLSIVSDVGRSLEKEGRIMSDANSRLNSSEVGDITKQLNDGRLSRHGLRERLMGLGIGFGAAFVLGLAGAQASPAPEATVALTPARRPRRPTPSSRFSKKLGIAAGSTAGITAGKAATPSGGLHVLRTFLRIAADRCRGPLSVCLKCFCLTLRRGLALD
jgi:hypothetical protein